ncbi:MAG: ABC transporter permease [Gammaproteobacteria bacterium]
MWSLAFRNLFRNYVRTLLTLSGIVLGVVGLILSGGFIEDVFVQLREATIHSQLGHVQISMKDYANYGRRDPYKYLVDPPEQLSAPLRGLPPVKRTLLRLNFTGLANNGRADLPIIGDGVEPDKEAALGSFLIVKEGRQLTDADVSGILIGSGVARSLKLKPGDSLTVLANTPDGAMNSLDFTVIGVFQSFSKEYDDRAVRIPLASAQELLVTGGVHTLVIELNDTAQTNDFTAALRAALPAHLEASTWYELADFYQKTEDLYKRQFGILQLIILIMVVLSVANSVNMAIQERIGEFGTLLALGNRRRSVFRLVLMENGILGFSASVIGVLLGIGLAWGISTIGIPMPPPPSSDVGYTARIIVVPAVLLAAFVVGWGATVIASLLPARKASGLPIVDALRANI